MSENFSAKLEPRIVAVETSGRLGSVALALGGKLLASRELSTTSRHAVELMPMIEKMTQEQGWKPAQIEQIYVSLGPGSFTGLRIAVAMGRAMAQAIGCKLVGVPSLDVIAQNALTEFKCVVAMLDAKRGQVFAARYERGAQGELVRATEPALVEPRPFLMEAGAGRICVIGEGVDYHREAIFGAGSRANVVEVEKSLWRGRAEVVHRLGWEMARRGEFTEPTKLLPIYIRLPEAEEVWRKKNGVAEL